jgi:uncharacterized protein (DUF433 family)
VARSLASSLARSSTPYDGIVTPDLPERIDIDPSICLGKPRIKGTRIWVGLILGLMADGMSSEEILHDYPELTNDDLRACLAYGAQLAVGRFVDVA